MKWPDMRFKVLYPRRKKNTTKKKGKRLTRYLFSNRYLWLIFISKIGLLFVSAQANDKIFSPPFPPSLIPVRVWFWFSPYLIALGKKACFRSYGSSFRDCQQVQQKKKRMIDWKERQVPEFVYFF